MQELAMMILDHYKDKGLWTAEAITNHEGQETGHYIIGQRKLNQNQYDAAKLIIQGLNANGYTPSEQTAQDKRTREWAENEQRKLMSQPKF